MRSFLASVLHGFKNFARAIDTGHAVWHSHPATGVPSAVHR